MLCMGILYIVMTAHPLIVDISTLLIVMTALHLILKNFFVLAVKLNAIW